jgi:thioredoxin 1
MAVHTYTDADIDKVLNDNSKVVIKYYADWCGSCKLFAPKFRRLSEDERFTGIHFAEVNAEENEHARELAGVDNLPFLAVFQGGKLAASSATSKEDKAVEMLEKLNAL